MKTKKIEDRMASEGEPGEVASGQQNEINTASARRRALYEQLRALRNESATTGSSDPIPRRRIAELKLFASRVLKSMADEKRRVWEAPPASDKPS